MLFKLSVAVLVLVCEFSLIYSQCTTELGVSYGGTDLTASIASTNTVGSCCLDCCANSACLGFVYDSTTKKCTLKSTLTQKLRATFSVASGLRTAGCPAANSGPTTTTVAVPTTSTVTVSAPTTTVSATASSTTAAPTTTTPTTTTPANAITLTGSKSYCLPENNVAYNLDAYQISSSIVSTPTACCAECARNQPSCKSWTFANPVCSLYRVIPRSSVPSDKTAVSGQIAAVFVA